MKNVLAFFALMALALAATAQEGALEAAERARIKAERDAAESVFKSEEKACYAKFAVNDCLNAAKARRREAVAALRRQEISLNDAQRRRKAAERLREVEQRAGEPPPKPAKARATPPQGAASGAAPATRPAKTPKAPKAPSPNRAKARPADSAERAADAARSRAQHEERLERAEERRAKLEKRLADRQKPAAQPLPVPP